MQKSKNIYFSGIIIILFFALLEGTARLFVFPGSSDYIERRIIEHGLKQKKAGGEFRILLYGESTMHGSHLFPHSTIDKWIKLYLADLLPEGVSSRVTTANFGRMGANSRFIRKAFLETVPYKPDLAVFYMAHNDFCIAENRRYIPRPFMKRFYDVTAEFPKHSSFLNFLNRLVIRSKIMMGRKKDTRLKDVNNWYTEGSGLPDITEADYIYRPSPQFDRVKIVFENNVKKTIDIARRHSIPVIFFERIARWKGYEPIRPIHDPAITKDALALHDNLFSRAEEEFTKKRYAEALALYDRCARIDPMYALTYHRMAECRERLGEFSKANKFYSEANDLDRFPLRAPSDVNRFYESLRLQNLDKVHIIRTQELFEESSPDGIVGDELIGDQIHPTVDGQALMALEVVKLIYDNDMLAPKARWRWDRLRTAGEMKKSLNIDKDAEFEIELGLAGYVGHHYVKAREYLERALAIKPGSIFAKSWLAWAYWKSGEKRKAIDLYRQLYREAPAVTSEHLKNYPDIAAEMNRK
ncbi:MAG: tetratricopeptide repeat protein [Candidatus Omnitrophica bacterium]|nr:tetratricopeptide repeat protein [Candidatus Omnitrophota bacterium]